MGLRLTRPDNQSILEPDSVLLYRLIPGAAKTFIHRPENGGARIPLSVNADGYRGPALRRPAGGLRVAVYGDSFIESEVAVDSQTFVRRLERNLSQALARPVEAVNAGVVGYGPDQATLRFAREAGTLKPDLVVLAVFADNDFGDLVRDRLYRLAADSSVERAHPVLAPELQTYLEGWAHPTGWRHLALVRWIQRTLEKRRGTERLVLGGRNPPARLRGDSYVEMAVGRLRDDYATATAPGSDTVRNILGDYYDADLATEPASASARYKTRLMQGVIADFQRVAAQAGVPAFLVIIPSPIDACPSYDFQVDSVRYPAYDRNRLTGIVARAADSAGLRRINLLDAFRAKGACSLYFRGGDFHWNDAGQAFAAGVVADSLRQLIGIPPRP